MKIYNYETKEALVYINKIRERAGLGKLENAYPAVVDSKEELRKWIRQERMVELMLVYSTACRRAKLL